MIRQTSYTLDQSKCTGCELCTRVCFFHTFEADANGVRVVPGGQCLDCGHCFAVCPAGAIVRKGGAAVEEITRPRKLTYEQLMGLLVMRRSRREFKEQRLPREAIEKLLQAAVQAPNGLNKQQVGYTVITNPEVIKELSGKCIVSMGRMAGIVRNPVFGAILRLLFRGIYDEARDLLPEVDALTRAAASGEDPVLYNAPCVILVHSPKQDVCGSENALYCAGNILLAAETLGLGACVVGFVTGPMKHDPRLKQLVRLPKGRVVHTAMVVGYPEFAYTRPAPKAEPHVNLVE